MNGKRSALAGTGDLTLRFSFEISIAGNVNLPCPASRNASQLFSAFRWASYRAAPLQSIRTLITAGSIKPMPVPYCSGLKRG